MASRNPYPPPPPPPEVTFAKVAAGVAVVGAVGFGVKTYLDGMEAKAAAAVAGAEARAAAADAAARAGTAGGAGAGSFGSKAVVGGLTVNDLLSAGQALFGLLKK